MKALPKIGIYIPTFNREMYLKECISSFIPELSGFGLPIYVSNNGSTDGTIETLTEIRTRFYSELSFVSNEVNQGYGRNVVKALHSGDSEYVWLFGDDDLVFPGANTTIQDYPGRGYDYLVLNSTVFDRYLQNKLKERVLSLFDDKVFEADETDDLFRYIGELDLDYIAFMSSIITKKEYLMNILESSDIVQSSEFIHTSLFYKAIAGKRGIMVAEPLIKNRFGNYRTNVRTWLWEFPESIAKLHPEYSDETIQLFLKEKAQKKMIDSVSGTKLGKGISLGELMGQMNGEQKYILLRTKLLIIIIAAVPDRLYRTLFFIVKKFLDIARRR